MVLEVPPKEKDAECGRLAAAVPPKEKLDDELGAALVLNKDPDTPAETAQSRYESEPSIVSKRCVRG